MGMAVAGRTDGSMPREWRFDFSRRGLARAARAQLSAWEPERLVIAYGMVSQQEGTRDLARDCFVDSGAGLRMAGPTRASVKSFFEPPPTLVFTVGKVQPPAPSSRRLVR